MPKKICPNGHVYDSAIYGDECPMCPQQDTAPSSPAGTQAGFSQQPLQGTSPGGHTMMVHGGGAASAAGKPQGAPSAPAFGNNDPVGDTMLRQQPAKPQTPPQAPQGGRAAGTIIRQVKGAPQASGRKLVGFLVTYNRDPMGKAFNIYEGKNYIGRAADNDISVPEDRQMSGRHMSILYRNVDNKFKYRDEQSSNGTFINKELSDDGELQNYDIIRLGGTVFIFIAIPKLG